MLLEKRKVAVDFWHFSICTDLSQDHVNVECIVMSSVTWSCIYITSVACLCFSNFLFHPINFALDAFGHPCVSKASLTLMTNTIEQQVVEVTVDVVQVSYSSQDLGDQMQSKSDSSLGFSMSSLLAYRSFSVCQSANVKCMQYISYMPKQNYEWHELSGTFLGLAFWLGRVVCNNLCPLWGVSRFRLNQHLHVCLHVRYGIK